MKRTTGYGIGVAGLVSGVLAACLVVSAPLGAQGPDNAQGQGQVTAETIDGWMSELSNWGRWGDDDESAAQAPAGRWPWPPRASRCPCRTPT